MNKQLLLTFLLLTLTGCNPFNERVEKTNRLISTAENNAKKSAANYEMVIRQVKPYQVYQYKTQLTDPFRIRQFLIKKQQDESNLDKEPAKRCLPPDCTPPIPHEPQLLESYALQDLKFVGTLGNNNVVLVKTPEFGVVTVGLGDYMGKNNGRIQTINESSIILQEKIEKNGIWTNKKTVLMIAR